MPPDSITKVSKVLFLIGMLGIAAGTLGIRLASTLNWIRFFDNLHWTAGTASAAGLAWLGWHRAQETADARMLRWFAVGFTGYAIGQIIWDIQTWLDYSQFPSYSDLFYLWLGPCLSVGLVLEFRARKRQADLLPVLLDLMALSIAALTLILVLYLSKTVVLEWLRLAVLAAYPLTLVIPNVILLLMIPALRLRLTRTLALFFSAIAVTAWSWMKWNLMALDGSAVDGDWFNISFSLAILLAGYTTTIWQLESSDNWLWDWLCEGFLRLLPLVSVIISCVAVIVTTTDTGLADRLQKLINYGALLVILLAMLRQGLLLKERDQLLKAQTEVIRSKSLLQMVIDNAPTRVFWKNTDCRYLGCNVLFARDAGFNDPKALLGKDDFAMAWRQQAAMYQADDQAVMTSGRVKLGYEEPQTTPAGETIWLRTSKVPLQDEIGNIIGVLGIYDDITEQKRTSEKLAALQSRLQFLLSSSPVVIYSANYGGSFGATYVSSNIDHYGYRSEDFINIPDFWIEHVHPDDRTALDQELAQIIAEGTRICEYRFRDSRGEFHWVRDHVRLVCDADGQPKEIVGCMIDISDQKSAEENLRLMARLFRDTEECIMVANAERNLIEVNKAFSKITGYSRDEVLGQNPRFLKSGRHKPEFYAAVWEAINRTGHWRGEIWNQRKDGEIYASWITISSVMNEQNTVTHYVSISSDITTIKQHQQQLEYIAHYDALTGIPNRLLLADRLQHALAQTQRENKMMAVCYLDLDGFKPINDSFGHDTGDQVLVTVAKRILQTIRASDTLARLGGDEFVVLLLGLEQVEEGIHSLNRLMENIAQPIPIRQQQSTVTASIGVTVYPQDNQDPDTLLRHADQAMYVAKQLGKNRYHIYDPTQDASLKIQLERKQRMQQGLLAGEFELFYQPKVDLRDGSVIGVEALIRWRHPELGLLPPSEFLHYVDLCDLTIEIGEWVIGTALTQLERWRQDGLRLGISINIAASHLQMPHFIDSLRQRLDRCADIAPQLIEIEILETVALNDIQTVAGIIESGLALGIRFALDDFGTGYSSLAYLRRLPVETLKIDQSFVRDMLDDRDDLAIVEGIIALAHTFKRTTVAEGVETAQHIQALQKLGCDIAQGYGIARPMPASEVVNWCQNFAAQDLQRKNASSGCWMDE